MATVFENRPAPVSTRPEDEAALHNAHIKERYEKLRNAEATQLSESFSEAERSAYSAPGASASTLAPERPRETFSYSSAPTEEAPRTNGYVHTRVDSPLFTPETLDRTLRREDYGFMAPVAPEEQKAEVNEEMAVSETVNVPVNAPAAPVEMPVTAVNVEPRAEGYALNGLAKMVIAAFAALVIVMLTVICINTQVIRRKTVQLRNLEQRQEELVQENAELEKNIEDAKSFDKILEYAEEHGMIYDPS